MISHSAGGSALPPGPPDTTGRGALEGDAAYSDTRRCKICAAGKWSSHAGRAVTCTNCPAGTYLADRAGSASAHDSETLCLVCSGGRYAPSNGTETCQDCPSGKIIKSFDARDHQSITSCEPDCKPYF